MTVLAFPDGWALTTEHSSSSHGIPVLVRHGEAYGPDDKLPWGERAASYVGYLYTLISEQNCGAEELAFVRGFISLGAE